MAIETRGTVELMIRNFIADNLTYGDDLKISDEDSFLDSSIIDSTGILELILFAETTFNIEVRDEDVVPENFDSVSKLANYIRSKQQA